MTNEAITQAIKILIAHYPYRYQGEDMNALAQRIGSDFSDVSGKSFLYVLELKCRESRNPVDLNDVHSRALLVDTGKITNYEKKRMALEEHLATPRDQFRTESFFSMFAEDEPRDYDQTSRELVEALNEAIRELPRECIEAYGIEEVKLT